MSDNTVSALLVDDHALILQGLKHIISQVNEVDEVYTASSASEALALVGTKPIHICILDIELPDMGGFELIDKIREIIPESKILVNTMHEESWIVKKIIGLNVDGVVLKSSNTDELKCAIESILEGKEYFCNEFLRIKKRICDSSEFSHLDNQLTQREYDVLMAISNGLQTREIAESLHVSVNTVESHRKNLFFKLGVRNSVELIIKAIKSGIINIDPNTKI